MALGIATYVDPGVYVRERIQPSSVTVTSDRVLGIVGLAPRTVRTDDEAVVRGKITSETLALATSTPYIDALTSTSDRDRNNAVCYRNGQALALGAWSFSPASLVGDEWAGATIVLTGKTLFTFSIDGKEPVTVDFSASGGTLPVVTVGGASGSQVVARINYELSDASGAHYTTYGTDYATFATQADTPTNPLVTLTSPLTTKASDVKVFLSSLTDASAMLSAGSGWTNISGTRAIPIFNEGVQAASVVKIEDAFYNVADTYTVDYIAVDSLTDALVNAVTATPLSDILSVGSFPGGLNYAEDTDYEETGNTLDWLVSTNAQSTITGVAGTYAIVLATSDVLVLSINGLAALIITLTAGGAITAAAAVLEINAALVADKIGRASCRERV